MIVKGERQKRKKWRGRVEWDGGLGLLCGFTPLFLGVDEEKGESERGHL